MHFKFINSVVKASEDLNLPRDHELSAYNLHTDFFLSGLERVLLVSHLRLNSGGGLILNPFP